MENYATNYTPQQETLLWIEQWPIQTFEGRVANLHFKQSSI